MANKSCLSVALQQQQWGALAQKMQMQKSEHKRLYIELVLYHHLIAAETVGSNEGPKVNLQHFQLYYIIVYI